MPLMIHNGKLLIRNGALALSPACCCDCMTVELEVAFYYGSAYAENPWGTHTIFEEIDAGATGCGALSFYLSRPTMKEIAEATTSGSSCTGGCGESVVTKEAKVYGKFHIPYFTTGFTTIAARVGYQCDRYYITSGERPYGELDLTKLRISGLPTGKTLHARYRRAGGDSGTIPIGDYATAGTYSAWTSMKGWQGGTSGTNENIYVEIWFT